MIRRSSNHAFVHRDGMVEDATVSPTAHKRRRSASPTPSVVPSTDANPNNYTKVNEVREITQRLPKRLRRSHDIPAYDAPVQASGLAASNPLSRRMLKQAAKKARRAARPRGQEEGGGMEMDDDGLGDTFLANNELEMAIEA